MTRCSAPADLLLYALQLPGDREQQHVAQHVSQCASCQSTIDRIRESASVLQSSDADAAETGGCLDEMMVASVAERGVDMQQHPQLISHLALCARCRENVASIARLLRDPSIVAEIRKTDVIAGSSITRKWRVAGAGGLAALAAVVTFMVAGSDGSGASTQPVASILETNTHREQSVTTTVAPSLIAPAGVVAAADTFSWTSVPHADRYRLTVFDREGRTVWQTEASDTAIASPKSIIAERGTAYLWKVEARTGWDRWVASEMTEFSLINAERLQ